MRTLGRTALSIAAALATAQLSGVGGPTVTRAIAVSLAGGGGLVAVVAALVRARRCQGWQRRAWLLLALVPVAETAGRATWWWSGPPGHLAWPTPTSAGHGVAGLVLLLAFVALRAPATDSVTWRRTMVDALGITVALALLCWNAVLWPMTTVHAFDAPLLGAVLHVGLDVVVMAVGLLWLSRARYHGGTGLPTLLPLCGAAVTLAAGDTATVGFLLQGAYRPGSGTDLALAAAWAMMTVAASQEDGDDSEITSRERVAVFAATVPVVAAAFVVVVYQATQHVLPPLTLYGLLLLGALLLLRVTLATLDNLELSRTLESQVQERTLALVTRADWFRSLVQNSSDVVTVLEPDGTIRYQSPAMQRLFGYDPSFLTGTSLVGLLRPEGARALSDALDAALASPRTSVVVELALWHRDGYWCETETIVTSLVDDPDLRGLVLNTRDVSERKQLQDRLRHQAYHDALTELGNRPLFHQRLTEALDEYVDMPGAVAVLYCDLDGFKAVNDALGHDTGDALLVLVAERLRRCVRPSDLVTRFGGDEFAVLVSGRDAGGAAGEVAARMADSMRKPFSLDGREVTVGVSIGIAVTSPDAATAEVLMRNADLAMYRAKSERTDKAVLFEPTMHDALLARLEMEDDLRQALGRGEFMLHYQPTFDLRTGRMVGCESLLRWYHPERGVVPPDRFVGVAEEMGFIETIGEWVLVEACRQSARWQRFAHDGEPFTVGVNISARQVRPELVDMVARVLEETGLPPGSLLLEMTESVLMDRADQAVEVLGALKALGVRLAVDDFGTGYSSLSYLSRFPVDVLKIDKHFVDGVAGKSDRSELVRTIVQIGRALDLVTVAEGIENWAQYHAVREMGCTLGQGYLFSRPVPASSMNEMFIDGYTTEGVFVAALEALAEEAPMSA